MFHCERCGSRYSAMHAATIENCPRCLVRDRTAAQLAFKAFESPSRAEAVPSSATREHSGRAGDRTASL
jgi:predicted  nucleic acid-binding Zn-ribbon protein